LGDIESPQVGIRLVGGPDAPISAAGTAGKWESGAFLVAVEQVEEEGLGDGDGVVVGGGEGAEVLDGFEVHEERVMG